MALRTVSVFCGSSHGEGSVWRETAEAMGRALAAEGLGMVYGGGDVGLMGVVAQSAMKAGVHVTGVIPYALAEKEHANPAISELITVDTMHERKAEMARRSDGFVAMPGGIGTLEEIFEQWTWAQLGFHRKPSVFLNIDGYFDPLRAMTEQMVAQGFLRKHHADIVSFEVTPEAAIAALRAHQPPVSILDERMSGV